MSSTLSIYVSEASTPQHNGGDGRPGQSLAGHMWLGLDSSKLQTAKSMGFAPLKHGSIAGEGMVVRDDSFNYYGPKVHRIDIEVTDTQRAAIIKFAQNPKAYGFDMDYQGVSNSCVDFAWKALDVAGLNPTHTQGRALPTANLPELQKLAQNLKTSPHQQHLLRIEDARNMGQQVTAKKSEPLVLEGPSGNAHSRHLAQVFREMPKDQALQRYPELRLAYLAQESAQALAIEQPRKIAPQSREAFMLHVNGQIARQLSDFGPTMTDPRRKAPSQDAGRPASHALDLKHPPVIGQIL